MLGGASDDEHACFEEYFGEIFYLRVYLRVKSFIVISFLQVLVQVLEGNFVSWLILSVFVRVLLDCVVGQVNVFVHILSSVLFAASSDVAFSVEP